MSKEAKCPSCHKLLRVFTGNSGDQHHEVVCTACQHRIRIDYIVKTNSLITKIVR